MRKLLFSFLALAMLSSTAAASCSMPEKRALSMAPFGTVVMYGKEKAFTKLYNRFNMQRMSLGYGFTKADKLIVGITPDTSVIVFMSLDDCYIKVTGAHLDANEWSEVMRELGLTLDDFTTPVDPLLDGMEL